MTPTEKLMYIKGLIRDVEDFPKPGIVFKDIVPLLNNAKGFGAVIDLLHERYLDQRIDQFVGIESRGFIFGAALADRLQVPFNLIRKKGKLPGETVSYAYDLEYGSDEIEIQKGSVRPTSKVVLIDDLLATGGTAAAAVALLRSVNARVLELACVIELKDLEGRKSLGDLNTHALLSL